VKRSDQALVCAIHWVLGKTAKDARHKSWENASDSISAA
jgi:hypothetical protein